ncbi:AraC family transcriptional regulator [Cognatishimia maritima]|uniref:AraC-type DNA-binding protein n=1 Tax=Cognatishimia maritima TaxID=870908 RepID=A0A1M5VJ69_9RHOB|nr:AraC family transcriptional regulator [Cognatishimia maritima]SHH75286.1 AraC-type DNA-binding protein [Cognatishimia maritima]
MSFSSFQTLCKVFSTRDAQEMRAILPAAHIFQRNETSTFEAVVYNPVICLILQGKKEMRVGDQVIGLSEGTALLVSHDLPVTSKITEASPENPYLALILSIDLGILRSLYEQVGDALTDTQLAKSLSVSEADPAWLDPMARYIGLMDTLLDAQVLGPMILKEIHFRLLMSPIGGMLRNLLAVDSHASRISKSIQRIRTDFRRPLVVGELAQVAGMSQSSFHEHFKSVTGTTPLQYQKDLRMIEARALLERGVPSVSVAGFEVGYESPTHFSRDYSRKFGCSPRNHLARAS